MNKQNTTNIANTTNTTCGSKSRSLMNKNKIRVPPQNIVKNTSCTSGSYITYVNLYLHPNSQNNSPNGSTLSSPIDSSTQINQTTERKIKGIQKPKCSNKECHYYDPMCDENYFCCNPSCSCFDPYYFDPYYYDPYYFDPYYYD